MTAPSPQMVQFLADWLDWAENDGSAPSDDSCFRPYAGLCLNSSKRGHSVTWELRAMLEADGLDPEYPFGEADYEERADKLTMHRCPKRLAWVRDKLAAEL